MTLAFSSAVSMATFMLSMSNFMDVMSRAWPSTRRLRATAELLLPPMPLPVPPRLETESEIMMDKWLRVPLTKIDPDYRQYK
jgi:hypothetical protein